MQGSPYYVHTQMNWQVKTSVSGTVRLQPNVTTMDLTGTVKVMRGVLYAGSDMERDFIFMTLIYDFTKPTVISYV